MQPRWTVINHHLATHKLTRMRDVNTDAPKFRRLMRQMGLLLCSEMTRDLELTETSITTSNGDQAIGYIRKQTELVVMPILRAGSPLADAFLELLPSSRVGHVGIHRDKQNEYSCYVLSIPRDQNAIFFVLDPAISQGKTSAMAVDYLLTAGIAAERIRFGCLIASQAGLAHFYNDERRLPIKIYTFCDADTLDGKLFITPGIGNIGARLFRQGG